MGGLRIQSCLGQSIRPKTCEDPNKRVLAEEIHWTPEPTKEPADNDCLLTVSTDVWASKSGLANCQTGWNSWGATKSHYWEQKGHRTLETSLSRKWSYNGSELVVVLWSLNTTAQLQLILSILPLRTKYYLLQNFHPFSNTSEHLEGTCYIR